MVFVLGLLSLLQITFLPGLIFLKLFKFEMPFCRTITASFVITLIFNYILVFLLAISGFYLGVVVWSIFVVETLFFIWLYRNNLQKSIYRCFFSRANKSKPLDINFAQNKQVLLILFLFFIAALYFLLFLSTRAGFVFYAWDAVNSYNNWATMWAGNSIAHFTRHYPQLIPINWSIPYMMIGHINGALNYQMFPKTFMLIFPLLFVFMAWDLFKACFRVKYLFAGIVLLVFLPASYEAYLGTGFVDTAVASLSFAAVYILVLLRNGKIPLSQHSKYLWLGCVFAATAAVTKQAGLFILFMYPVLTQLMLLKPNNDRFNFKLLVWQYILMLLLVLPWYVYVQIQLQQGDMASELPFVLDGIYRAKYFTDFSPLHVAIANAGLLSLGFVLFAFYGALKDKTWRLPFFLVGLPMFLIWSVFYYYDVRNIAVALPFIGFIAGLGIYEVLFSQGFRQLFTSIFQLPVWCLLIAVICSVGIIVFTYSESFSVAHLNAIQERQAKLLKYSVHGMLYRYQKKHGFTGKVVTTWDLMAHLPGLSQYYAPFLTKQQLKVRQQSISISMNPKLVMPIVRQVGAHYILPCFRERELEGKKQIFDHYSVFQKWQQKGLLHKLAQSKVAPNIPVICVLYQLS